MDAERRNLLIAEKQSQITHYIGVLERYQASSASGRWYDQGRRHLEDLKAELAALQVE